MGKLILFLPINNKMKTVAYLLPSCPFEEYVGWIVEVKKFLDFEEVIVRIGEMGELKMRPGWYQIVNIIE